MHDLTALAADLDALPSRIAARVALDLPLLRQYPDSLGSLLLARTFGDPAFDDARAAWRDQLRGRPWVEALSALSNPTGLLARLPAGHDTRELSRVSFDGSEVVVLSSRGLHPTLRPPEQVRDEVVRWRWRTGEVDTVPAPVALPPTTRVEHRGWGPLFVVEDGVDKALPCPEDGSASGVTFLNDRLIVYGTQDAYDGGFVYLLDPQHRVVRKLDTPEPVYDVLVSDRHLLVVSGRRAHLWRRDGVRAVHLPEGHSPAMSPCGTFLAVTDDGSLRGRAGASLTVHLVAALPTEPPPTDLPVAFSPDGRRFTRSDGLFDADTGARIATIPIRRGAYLEGGPAQPSFHLGNRHLVDLYGRLAMWRTDTGEAVTSASLRFPHWYRLAHNAAGDRLAVVRKGKQTAEVHRLPDGEVVGTLTQVPGEDDDTLVLTDDGLALLPTPATPDGWNLERERHTTRFTHLGTGRAIVLPVAGDWVIRPGDRTTLACRKLAARLHGP
jgi:hypothetical protein